MIYIDKKHEYNLFTSKEELKIIKDALEDYLCNITNSLIKKYPNKTIDDIEQLEEYNKIYQVKKHISNIYWNNI
jgi:hypothetical protein